MVIRNFNMFVRQIVVSLGIIVLSLLTGCGLLADAVESNNIQTTDITADGYPDESQEFMPFPADATLVKVESIYEPHMVLSYETRLRTVFTLPSDSKSPEQWIDELYLTTASSMNGVTFTSSTTTKNDLSFKKGKIEYGYNSSEYSLTYDSATQAYILLIEKYVD